MIITITKIPETPAEYMTRTRARAAEVIATETAKSERTIASLAREASARALLVYVYALEADGYDGYLATEHEEGKVRNALDVSYDAVLPKLTAHMSDAERNRVEQHLGEAFRAGRRGVLWTEEMCAQID